MDKYCLVVFSRPAEGREEEYNRWYDEQHLDDVLAIPGFTSARRLRIAQPDNILPAPYLALYEIETDKPEEVPAELARRSESGEMVLSDALDLATVSFTLFKTIAEK